MATATPYVAPYWPQNFNPGPDYRVYYDYSPSRLPNGRSGAAYSGVYGVAAGYTVSDGAGYTFRLGSDASLTVIDAPLLGRSIRQDDGSLRLVRKKWGLGKVYRPGDPSYEIILTRLKARDPNLELALGDASTGGTKASTDKVSWWANFADSLGLNKPETREQVATFISEQGPGLLDAVTSAFRSRGRDLTSLMKRLAEIRAKLPGITNPVRKARLQAEAQGIQAQISQIQAIQTDPSLQPGAALPEPGTPFWIFPAVGLLGTAAVGTILYFALRKKR